MLIFSNFLLSFLILFWFVMVITTGPTILMAKDYGYQHVKKWITEYLKNREVEAQIDGELETKINNRDIFRIKWTGNPRIIDAGQSDPYDSRFILHGGAERVRVNGDGTLSPVNSVTSDDYPNSPRLYVKGPWKDTEITIWAKATSFDYLQLRGRNDHNSNCGFGGYLVIFRSSGSTAIAKEITHPLYTKKIAGDHFEFPEDKWIGYRARFIDATIEGFVNTDGSWKKVISAIDTGQWSYQNEAQVAKAEAKCGSISNEPFTREQPYNFVRINNGVDVFFKLYSIREIKL